MSYTFDRIIEEMIPKIKQEYLNYMESELHLASPEHQEEMAQMYEREGYLRSAKETREQSNEEWASNCRHQGDRQVWLKEIDKEIASLSTKMRDHLTRHIKGDGMSVIALSDAYGSERGMIAFNLTIQTPKGVKEGTMTVLGGVRTFIPD